MARRFEFTLRRDEIEECLDAWDVSARVELEAMRSRERDGPSGSIARGIQFERLACEVAAETGRLECLEYARARGYAWGEWTCAYAALKGHLDILRYAHEHGCPWSDRTCEYAAENGRLDILRYAHEHGCPWDKETCWVAAQNGHLVCLRYAMENGCERHEHACWIAVVSGHLDCLKCAYEHGCSWNSETQTHALSSFDHVQEMLDIVHKFRDSQNIDTSELYHEIGPTCWWCALRGSLDCLRYARDAGIENANDYGDLIDEYDRVWRHFVVHVALSVRATTDDDGLELSARRFRELYKDFDAQRKRLKDRARERAVHHVHDVAKRLGVPIE